MLAVYHPIDGLVLNFQGILVGIDEQRFGWIIQMSFKCGFNSRCKARFSRLLAGDLGWIHYPFHFYVTNCILLNLLEQNNYFKNFGYRIH